MRCMPETEGRGFTQPLESPLSLFECLHHTLTQQNSFCFFSKISKELSNSSRELRTLFLISNGKFSLLVRKPTRASNSRREQILAPGSVSDVITALA